MTNLSLATGPAPAGAPSRMFIVVGFILSAAFTTTLTTLGGMLLAERQVTRTEQVQHIDAFTKASEAFPALVNSYSGALLDKRDVTPTLTKLKDNIILQQTLVNDAENGLSPIQAKHADEYQKTLADVLGLLDQVKTAEGSGPILQPLADAVKEREIVMGELRSSAGLKTKPSNP